MASALLLLAQILGIWFFASLVVSLAWILARRRDAPPEATPRMGVELILFECSHCRRHQLWSERFGDLLCICGGIYRDAWIEPRVIREAAEIVEKLA